MIDRHSRVRDARSLPHRFTPTTLPLVGLPRHGADGEGEDASGGAAIPLRAALVAAVLPILLIASFAVFAAVRGY